MSVTNTPTNPEPTRDTAIIEWSEDEARSELLAIARGALKPCLWHGVSGGPHGPQPVGGVRSCSQCERRHDKVVVRPDLILAALGGGSGRVVSDRPPTPEHPTAEDDYPAAHAHAGRWIPHDRYHAMCAEIDRLRACVSERQAVLDAATDTGELEMLRELRSAVWRAAHQGGLDGRSAFAKFVKDWEKREDARIRAVQARRAAVVAYRATHWTPS